MKSLFKLKLVILFSCFIEISLFIGAGSAQELNLRLPIYSIEMDSQYLTILYGNPWTDEYFPAIFVCDSIKYKCEVRFRGGTTRNLPKKSWRLKFENDDNIFNAEKINLNAEYRDRTLMRNHLAMKLFQYSGYPSANTRYINFFVNNEYKGVFLQVEEVDQNFIARNNRHGNSLYKAKNHGANMAPITNYEAYFTSWDKKIGHGYDYKDIQLLFSKFLYWNKQDFESNIENEVDVDNVLNYFAVEFAIVSIDCFTKNLFLFYNTDKNVWEIFPWDNDAAFGNHLRGNYRSSYVRFDKGSLSEFQILFQRLMESGNRRNSFNEKISKIINDGFDYLKSEIDFTYNQIKNDVYQDESKICTNTAFDGSIEQLKNFLIDRAAFLKVYKTSKRISLSNFYCSNPYPAQTNPEVIFRVKSAEKQTTSLNYIRNLIWDERGRSFNEETLELFDDGNHNDLEAGDLVYGNKLIVAGTKSTLIPYCFAGSGFYYPANGLFYINYVRTNTFALNQTINSENFYNDLEIEKIYKNNNEYFIELVNTSSNEIDISYCYLQSGKYYHNFLLPENTLIAGYDTLIITTNKDMAEYFFFGSESIGNFFFNIEIGDTVRLLSPALSELKYTVCNGYSQKKIESFEIIINEINYNSSNDFDPEDWIEFYNPQDFTVDVSGWYFKDEDDNHVFIFPGNTFIKSKGFLVLCRDTSQFLIFFPTVNNYYGDLSFGLSGGGELIRLFDVSGNIVDSLVYDDDPPWPTEPDGNGPTLELRLPSLDNSLAENWTSSKGHGTPGYKNSVHVDSGERIVQPANFILLQNYPNPFYQVTKIKFDLHEHKNAILKIYNIQGQLVKTLTPDADKQSVTWNGQGFSSGIYFYQIEKGNIKSRIRKAILVK